MANEIDSIMEDLRREVHKYVLFGQPEWTRASEPTSLTLLRQRQVVNSHLPIGWPTMPRSLPAKVATYAKKIVRRLLRWYVNPLVDQQNRFNDAAVTAISEQRLAWQSLEATVRDLQDQVDDLRAATTPLGPESSGKPVQVHYLFATNSSESHGGE